MFPGKDEDEHAESRPTTGASLSKAESSTTRPLTSATVLSSAPTRPPTGAGEEQSRPPTGVRPGTSHATVPEGQLGGQGASPRVSGGEGAHEQCPGSSLGDKEVVDEEDHDDDDHDDGPVGMDAFMRAHSAAKDEAQVDSDGEYLPPDDFEELLAQAASNMPRRPSLRSLLDGLGWTHEVIPLPPGARGDALMPAPAAPKDWEDKTRSLRRVRGRVHEALNRWDARCQRDNLAAWQEVASELRAARDLEVAVQGVFVHIWDEVLQRCLTGWTEVAKQMKSMRKASKKLGLWMKKKSEIFSLGAWIAVWAHSKDWRIATQTRCLGARKPTPLEMELFFGSQRGRALINEMQNAAFLDLPELIRSSGVSLAGLLSVQPSDLLRCGVFPHSEKEKAGEFLVKLGMLMKPDTRRLDMLNMWPGAALNQVTIFRDEEWGDDDDEEGGGEDKGFGVLSVKKKGKELKGPTIHHRIVLTPKGAVQEAVMPAQLSEVARDWAWGYTIKLQPLPSTLITVRCKLTILVGCLAFCRVFRDKDGTEIGEAVPVAGRGSDALWYDFHFGHHDDEGQFVEEGVWLPGDFRVYVVPMPPADPLTSNKWVYFMDHKPLRKLNHYVICGPASFDNRTEPTISSRNIPLEIVICTKAGVDLNKDPAELVMEQKKKEREALADLIDADVVESSKKRLEELAAKRKSLMWIEPEEQKKGRFYANPPAGRDYASLEAIAKEEFLLLQALRRQLIRQTDKFFEEGLERIPNTKLVLDVNCIAGGAFNPRMNEYWIMHQTREKDGRRFHCCNMQGKFSRDVVLPILDCRVFSFDMNGDFFMGDSMHTLMKYRPTHPEKSDYFSRSWSQSFSQYEYPSGVAAGEEALFALFMNGAMLELDKLTGSLRRAFRLEQTPANAAGLIYALGRFIIVDSHQVKVVSLEGKHVPVLMGGFESVEERQGRFKVTLQPQPAIASGLDNPLMLWDGCFLWISEAQYRRTDEHHLPVWAFEWAGYAPLSAQHESIYGDRTLPLPPPEWSAKANQKAIQVLQDKGLIRAPSEE